MSKKTKSFLSALLAAIMMLSVFSVFAVSAAPDEYRVSYNKTIIESKTNEKVLLIASHTLPKSCKDVKYQWYMTTTTKLSEAVAIDGATEARYTPPTDVPGTYYFFCEVAGTVDGKEVSTLNYNNMSAIKVVLKAPLKLVPVGEDNIIIYKSSDVIFFKVKAENAESPSFTWYACDENGTTSGPMISIGDSLAINGIKAEKLGIPQYYACIASDINGMDFHIFSCTLEDESKKPAADDKKDEETEEKKEEDVVVSEITKLPFADVTESDWFYNDVKTAFEKGLVNGKTVSLFCPDDYMTYAEAVKLACAIYQLDRDGKVSIPNGSLFWYSTHMDFALTNGIIDEDLSDRANEKISRKEYVYIFYKALPEEKFEEINNISVGAIPDVEKGKYYSRIYTFYRAGILTGSDELGTFNPDSNIKRSEVAAILTRMTDANARKEFSLG